MTELGLAEDFEVLDRFVEPRGLTVVDAGCGAGALSLHLAGRGARVVAIEPDPVQAKANHERFADGDGVRFVETGAEAMPCGDASVDGVVFSKSLHHVPPGLMEAALAEAVRVLRPTGFLYVLEPEVEGAYSDLVRSYHDETAARRAALAALARVAEARVAEARFAEARVIRYRNVRRFADFESFVVAAAGASFTSTRREDVETAEVRRRFEAGRCAEGYRFEQPMRVNLYRGPRPA
jgi:ubiquinone/menaquinone biosynthesis C-methylase UbiE